MNHEAHKDHEALSFFFVIFVIFVVPGFAVLIAWWPLWFS